MKIASAWSTLSDADRAATEAYEMLFDKLQDVPQLILVHSSCDYDNERLVQRLHELAMGASEELREALLNLEDARNREALQRQTAEALLAGLRVLVFNEDPQALFLRLFDVMREPLDFEAAFVLTADDDGLFKTQATSDKLFQATVWESHSMFRRVIEGEPVAVFNTEFVSEWSSQSRIIKASAKSALHFSIRSSEQKALFVCTHSSRGHFSRDHLALAHRFSMLAVQAMQKLEVERYFILGYGENF